MKIIDLKNKKGFAVLFTVLISSIILAIAIGISSISYQEIVLSSSAREGNISFYAADTGAECALYWDVKQDISSSDGQYDINCAGNSLSTYVDSSSGSVIFYPSTFNINLNNKNCAVVTITKDTPSVGYTTVESLGYNVACGQLNSNPPNPRLVERAIRVTY